MTFGAMIHARITELRSRGRIVSVRIDGGPSFSPVACTDHVLTWTSYGDHPTESDHTHIVNLALVREVVIEDCGPGVIAQPA